MSRLLNLFRQSFVSAVKETPSSVARDRLSVMLVHQRHLQQLSDVDMEALQKELTVVVQKYVKVGGAEPVNYSGKFSFLKLSYITHSLCIAYIYNILSITYIVKHENGLDLLEIHFPLAGRNHNVTGVTPIPIAIN